jgi:hypothetical protein
MYYIGLDVASKSSFVHIIDGRGKKIENEESSNEKPMDMVFVDTMA